MDNKELKKRKLGKFNGLKYIVSLFKTCSQAVSEASINKLKEEHDW